MSGNDPSETAALNELEALVRNLGEELATFRRRAIAAEAQLKDAGHAPSRGKAAMGERVADLETENDTLRSRVARAEDRVKQMLDTVRFLRQQLQAHSPGVGAGRA